MFFHRTPGIIKQIYPSLVWSMPSTGKSIYLTFDDGPVPGLTEYILEVLNTFKVKATFFCVGENLLKNKYIAERMVIEGHQLANHTFNHVNGWKTRDDNYFDNMADCEKQLELLGQKKKLFRPPYGKIKRSQIKVISASHKMVMWDVLSGDYSVKVTPGDCLRQTIKYTKSGSIVLFHDNLKAKANVEYTLPRYLDHFKKQNFEFKLV